MASRAIRSRWWLYQGVDYLLEFFLGGTLLAANIDLPLTRSDIWDTTHH